MPNNAPTIAGTKFDFLLCPLPSSLFADNPVGEAPKEGREGLLSVTAAGTTSPPDSVVLPDTVTLVFVPLPVDPLALLEPEELPFVPPAVFCAELPLLFELPPLLVPGWVTGGLLVG